MKLQPAPSELKVTIQQVERGIRNKNLLLDSKNKEYMGLVENRAQKKRVWRMAYRMKMLELSGESITLRKDLVGGDKEVSKLEMEYEVAAGIEKACLESMKDLRGQLDALRSFLSWHKSERFPTGM